MLTQDEQISKIAVLKRTIQDLTRALRQKEQHCEQLKHELEEKKQYLALLENMPLSVWVADIDGYIKYYNQNRHKQLSRKLEKGCIWQCSQRK